MHPNLAHIEGAYTNAKDIEALAKYVDVITIEIEHVNVQALFQIRDQYRKTGGNLGKGIEIFPSPETIAIVQDKLLQKRLLHKLNVPVADFVDLPDPSPEAIDEASKTLGLPFFLKARKNAYDGRGNFLVKDLSDFQQGLKTLKGPLYAEQYAKDIVNEIVVVVVRSVKGEIRSYGTTESVKQGKLGHLVRAPARLQSKDIALYAESLAKKAISNLGEGAIGVFGVEFFVLTDGESTAISCSHTIELIVNVRC